MEEREPIRFNPSDPKGMEALMDQYGDSQSPVLGVNDLGEDVAISIFHDKIVVMTYQSNGWARKNVYHRDGVREEIFDGRWDKPRMTEPRLS